MAKACFGAESCKHLDERFKKLRSAKRYAARRT